MPHGPMAKHPSARQRSNAPASTSREIVLPIERQPVPPLPELNIDWHPQVESAWDDMWQWPLVYESHPAQRHLFSAYAAMVDQFWKRIESGKSVTELANQIRMFAEQWGFTEKSLRHLQITIQQVQEGEDRRQRRQRRPPLSVAQPKRPEIEWGDPDEEPVDAEVVG